MAKVIKSFNVSVGEPIKIETPILNFESPPSEILETLGFDSLDDLTEEDIIIKAEKKAIEIIEEAEKKAQKIIKESLEKADEEREIVLEQAKKNGFEEGYNEAMSQCEDTIKETAMIKEHAIEECNAYLKSIEEQVISIILDISKKVVGAHISFNPEDMLYVVKDAFSSCFHREYVVLKVSESDYDYIVESKNKLLSMVSGVGKIDIVIDHSLESGSCLLETPYGSIDASISTRLNEIEKVFKSLVQE